jgi:hypothetical protein
MNLRVEIGVLHARCFKYLCDKGNQSVVIRSVKVKEEQSTMFAFYLIIMLNVLGQINIQYNAIQHNYVCILICHYVECAWSNESSILYKLYS